MVKFKNSRGGYSLIELLVFIVIISITFVAIIGALTYGVYAQTNAKMRQNALHLNSELLEWFRAFREECGYPALSQLQGSSYCMNSLDFSPTMCATISSKSGSCDNDSFVDTIFKRVAIVEGKTDPNVAPISDDVYISVTVTTSWPIGATNDSVSSSTYFSNYQ